MHSDGVPYTDARLCDAISARLQELRPDLQPGITDALVGRAYADRGVPYTSELDPSNPDPVHRADVARARYGRDLPMEDAITCSAMVDLLTEQRPDIPVDMHAYDVRIAYATCLRPSIEELSPQRQWDRLRGRVADRNARQAAQDALDGLRRRTARRRIAADDARRRQTAQDSIPARYRVTDWAEDSRARLPKAREAASRAQTRRRLDRIAQRQRDAINAPAIDDTDHRITAYTYRR